MAITVKKEGIKTTICKNCLAKLQYSSGEDEKIMMGNKYIICPQCGSSIILNEENVSLNISQSSSGAGNYTVLYIGVDDNKANLYKDSNLTQLLTYDQAIQLIEQKDFILTKYYNEQDSCLMVFLVVQIEIVENYSITFYPNDGSQIQIYKEGGTSPEEPGV